MDLIREIVSGKKKRLKDGKFNLDLTYITPRIIAMSYPASGLESAYRNHIDDVSKYLKDKHGKSYMVYNLSGRVYKTEKFDDHVFQAPWDDHHSPPIQTLFEICHHIHEWLKGDIKRVIVVHCLAGKGRTGSVICCYLLYSGKAQNTDEALIYYKKQRFAEGGGVTQPSQIRYVRYFEEILRRKRSTPIVYRINSLSASSIPKFNSDKSFRPHIEIWEVKYNKIIYSDKKDFSLTKAYMDHGVQKLNQLEIKIDKDIKIVGDILINVYNMSKNLGITQSKEAFRFAFNTSFLKQPEIDESQRNEENTVPIELNPIIEKFDLNQLDPDKTASDERFPKDFCMNVSLTPICGCTSNIEFMQKCKICMPYFTEHEIDDWEKLYLQLDKYVKPEPSESSKLVFGDQKDNFEEVLGKPVNLIEDITYVNEEDEGNNEENKENAV